VGSNEDHIRPRIRRHDTFQQLHSVDFRHYQIEENNPWSDAQKYVEANLRVSISTPSVRAPS